MLLNWYKAEKAPAIRETPPGRRIVARWRGLWRNGVKVQ
jgi:hypothetical protein